MYLLGPDGRLATLTSPGHQRLCEKTVNKSCKKKSLPTILPTQDVIPSLFKDESELTTNTKEPNPL